MVGAGGADANADADATSSRFGRKQEAETEGEDMNVTPSGQASILPRRTAASLSRDGDDRLGCHRTVALSWWW
ncbi:hypothetical protein F4802DRAFT_485358 [Xylaria palmicola]|nr:hypothetical protein F4802DRAFT_485358 [Xylaria palmicola]